MNLFLLLTHMLESLLLSSLSKPWIINKILRNQTINKNIITTKPCAIYKSIYFIAPIYPVGRKGTSKYCIIFKSLKRKIIIIGHMDTLNKIGRIYLFLDH